MKFRCPNNMNMTSTDPIKASCSIVKKAIMYIKNK